MEIKKLTISEIDNIKKTKECCKISTEHFKEEFNKLSFIEKKFLTLSIVDEKYEWYEHDKSNTQSNIEIEKLFRLDRNMKKIAICVITDLIDSQDVTILTDENGDLDSIDSQDVTILTDENGDLYSTESLEKELEELEKEELEKEELEKQLYGVKFQINHNVKTLVGKTDGKKIRKGSKAKVVDINLKNSLVCVIYKDIEETYKMTELEAIKDTQKDKEQDYLLLKEELKNN